MYSIEWVFGELINTATRWIKNVFFSIVLIYYSIDWSTECIEYWLMAEFQVLTIDSVFTTSIEKCIRYWIDIELLLKNCIFWYSPNMVLHCQSDRKASFCWVQSNLLEKKVILLCCGKTCLRRKLEPTIMGYILRNRQISAEAVRTQPSRGPATVAFFFYFIFLYGCGVDVDCRLFSLWILL